MSNKQISREFFLIIKSEIKDEKDYKIKFRDKSNSSFKSVRVLPNSVPKLSTIKSIPSWTFIQSRALKNDGNPVVCGISSGNIEEGTQCIGCQVNANDNSQLWQLTRDGHLLSRIKGNYVMDIVNDGGSNQNNLIANNWNNILTQIWHFNNNGQIVNDGYSNMCIGIKDAINGPITPTNGTELIIGEPDSDDNVCFQWDTVPAYPLNSILTQPAQKFPQYFGNQLVAFSDIGLRLAGVNDIRNEYTNLIVPLSYYHSQLEAMSYPNYLSYEEFDEIREQLYKEFGYSQAIINLFKNYEQFHSELFQDNSATLNQLVTLCQLEQDSTFNLGGCMLQLLDGFLSTVLSEVPVMGGVLGNVVQTAINIGISNKTINPFPFQVKLSELWTELSSNFKALIDNTGIMETILLKDWGMMQSIYTLIRKSKGPDSLAWTTSMTGDMIKYASIGYKNSILQILMPTKYQIYRWDPNNNNYTDFPNNVPDYCKWTDSNGISYFIADKESTSVFPIGQLMNMLWNNKVNKQEFFLSSNGWNFPISIINNNYNLVTPSLSNNSSIAMKFQIEFDNNPQQIYDYNLPTYSSTFSLDCDHILYFVGPNSDLEISISDMSDNPIGTVSVQVVYHDLSRSTILLKDACIRKGFYLGSIKTNQGSHTDSFTSSINIPIYQDLSNN